MQSVLRSIGHHRYPLIVARFLIASALLAPLGATSADITEDDRAVAKERRDTVIARAKQEVKELEKQRSAAAKERNFGRVAGLLQEIRQAKQQLADATKKTVDDYAREIDQARGHGRDEPGMPEPKPPRDDSNDEPQQLAQKPAPDPEAEKATAAAEAERKKLSGGCPLKILMADFYHADVDSIRRGASLAGVATNLPPGLSGQSTLVRCTIKNCLNEPVEAYEMLVQFIDGFDTVIQEKVLQGTLLAPQEERTIRNGWREIETAVQVKVFLQRTKLTDGQIWRREVQHEQVSVHVKKPQGAELGR
jgi:hypothetical protein